MSRPRVDSSALEKKLDEMEASMDVEFEKLQSLISRQKRRGSTVDTGTPTSPRTPTMPTTPTTTSSRDGGRGKFPPLARPGAGTSSSSASSAAGRPRVAAEFDVTPVKSSAGHGRASSLSLSSDGDEDGYGTMVPHQVQVHGTSASDDDGDEFDTGTMVAHDTGTMVAHDTGTMVAHDTGTMVEHDTGTMVAHDTGTMVEHDTGTMIVHDTVSTIRRAPEDKDDVKYYHNPKRKKRKNDPSIPSKYGHVRRGSSGSFIGGDRHGHGHGHGHHRRPSGSRKEGGRGHRRSKSRSSNASDGPDGHGGRKSSRGSSRGHSRSSDKPTGESGRRSSAANAAAGAAGADGSSSTRRRRRRRRKRYEDLRVLSVDQLSARLVVLEARQAASINKCKANYSALRLVISRMIEIQSGPGSKNKKRRARRRSHAPPDDFNRSSPELPVVTRSRAASVSGGDSSPDLLAPSRSRTPRNAPAASSDSDVDSSPQSDSFSSSDGYDFGTAVVHRSVSERRSSVSRSEPRKQSPEDEFDAWFAKQKNK